MPLDSDLKIYITIIPKKRRLFKLPIEVNILSNMPGTSPAHVRNRLLRQNIARRLYFIHAVQMNPVHSLCEKLLHLLFRIIQARLF